MPMLPMYPRHPVRSQRGRIPVDCFIRIGYIGPRRSPINETAIPFSTSEGTSQTVTSSLGGGREEEKRRGREECVRNREDSIHEEDSTFADLQKKSTPSVP